MSAGYRVYRLDYGDGYPMGFYNWELAPSLNAALANFPEATDRDDVNAWQYVQIVPLASWKAYSFGNDGTQAWRHKATGYTVPDYCRQTGGTPELWTHNKKRQLETTPDSPVWDYVIEH